MTDGNPTAVGLTALAGLGVWSRTTRSLLKYTPQLIGAQMIAKHWGWIGDNGYDRGYFNVLNVPHAMGTLFLYPESISQGLRNAYDWMTEKKDNGVDLVRNATQVVSEKVELVKNATKTHAPEFYEVLNKIGEGGSLGLEYVKNKTVNAWEGL
ncbi:MAG: hypothetical protein KDK40_01615, partial [Chlamydiia bacterium]|nr:hypothetical protein [Chlamydiia bacterium]